MRRTFGVILIGFGLFALVLAVLLPTVVVHGSKKTPLNLDITQRSSGPAKLLNSKTNQVEDVQLRATRVVRTDTKASDDTNTTVFEYLCTVRVVGKTPDCLPKSDPRFLDTTTDRVTANRRTGESVHIAKYGEAVGTDTTVRHVGLSYKFPIDTKKQTYQFYLPDLKKAFPADYQGTSKVRGLTVYKFVSETGPQPYLVQHTFKGTYTDTRTVYVEPNTGTIVNGTEHQVQALADGTVALDATLSFDPDAVKYQTDFAQNKIDQLRLIQLWLPIVLGVLGVAALIGGVVLLRRRGSSGTDTEGEGRHDAPRPDDDPTFADPPVWAGSSQ